MKTDSDQGIPNKGPLSGIMVVDLTRHYPGPLCTWILKGLGAEVIKVEIPSRPDPLRATNPQLHGHSVHFEELHRGKQSLALDYFTSIGRKLLLDLLANADFLLESYRPGVMANAGLSPEQVLGLCPRLIYVSLTGYGQTGPYNTRAGHDLNFLSYSGLLAKLIDPEKPKPIGVQLADTTGGYLATVAALAALQERSLTGRGQHMDVSILDGCLPLALLQLAGSSQSSPNDLDMLDGRLPYYAIYACADGLLISIAALESKFWNSFCQSVNRPHWFTWHGNPEMFPTCSQELTALFKERTRADWLALDLEESCLSPVLKTSELASDPHIQARGFLHATDSCLALVPPLRFSGTSVNSAIEAAPQLGEHTQDILSSLGLNEKEIERLRAEEVILQC